MHRIDNLSPGSLSLSLLSWSSSSSSSSSSVVCVCLFVCDPKVDEQGQRLLYQIPLRVSHQLLPLLLLLWTLKKKKKRQVFFIFRLIVRPFFLVRLEEEEEEEEENWYINDDEICNQYERVDARGGREVDKSVAASSAISKQQRPVHTHNSAPAIQMFFSCRSIRREEKKKKKTQKSLFLFVKI